jgi:hypothetical protein
MALTHNVNFTPEGVFYDLLESDTPSKKPAVVMIHGAGHTGFCFLETWRAAKLAIWVGKLLRKGSPPNTNAPALRSSAPQRRRRSRRACLPARFRWRYRAVFESLVPRSPPGRLTLATSPVWIGSTPISKTRNFGSCLLGRARRRKRHCGNDCDVPGNELGGQRRKPITVAIGIAVFDDDALSFDEPRFSHAPATRVIHFGPIIPASAAQISNHWHRRLFGRARQPAMPRRHRRSVQ